VHSLFVRLGRHEKNEWDFTDLGFRKRSDVVLLLANSKVMDRDLTKKGVNIIGSDVLGQWAAKKKRGGGGMRYLR
jgi:hypothetical protein